MTKQVTDYAVYVYASIDSGIVAQILFNDGDIFAGRIDFYRDAASATSYIWTPTSTTDESQIYIVLGMPADLFPVTTELLRTEKPWLLELWPSGPLFGAFTDGYGGLLYTSADQAIGEEEVEERRMLRALRS